VVLITLCGPLLTLRLSYYLWSAVAWNRFGSLFSSCGADLEIAHQVYRSGKGRESGMTTKAVPGNRTPKATPVYAMYFRALYIDLQPALVFHFPHYICHLPLPEHRRARYRI
jgi:hypothetical protein